jgi:homoserine dehydrogenase
MSIDIGIIGAGVVGGGVIQILGSQSQQLAEAAGVPLRISHVCEINPDNLKGLDVDGITVTERVDDLINAENVKIICELIGGLEPARTFISRALHAGKNVVTANKMLLAYHGPELAEIARDNGVELRYEAAVAGGIPIIKALREGLPANRIEHVYGILNGTCNYILSRMTYEGLEFDAVLEQAQLLGFAETPPDLDVDGHDTAHKCQILASLCYSTRVDIDAIPVEGVRNITLADVSYALGMGYVIKLLAVIQETETGLDARVHPALLPETHLLAHVRNEFNAIFVKGDVTDATLYYGRGAGRLPTAGAVIADIVDIARRADAPAHPAFVYGRTLPLVDPGTLFGQYYLRLTTRDQVGVLGTVCTILGDHGVSIASVHQKDPHGEDAVHVVMMTHETVEAPLREALAHIDSLEFVIEPTHVIRVIEE